LPAMSSSAIDENEKSPIAEMSVDDEPGLM
jgi:hypothetical protein